jgi:hypothetical protein
MTIKMAKDLNYRHERSISAIFIIFMDFLSHLADFILCFFSFNFFQQVLNNTAQLACRLKIRMSSSEIIEVCHADYLSLVTERTDAVRR